MAVSSLLANIDQAADYVFYELTRSICPQCRRVIAAQVLLRENKVVMRKRCPDHGLFEGLIYGDAEELPFADDSFDAIICECAFCTFPDKGTAAREFYRVLKPGGQLGISDITRAGSLPEDLDEIMAWIACIGDAQPLSTYVEIFEDAGFAFPVVETHDGALADMVETIRVRLVSLELLAKLKQFDLPGVDFDQVRLLARSAADAVRAGSLGYALLAGCKPDHQP